MKIGIGYPAYIPGTSGATLIEWARKADKNGFSSLGSIDRLAYGNAEPLMAMAAAAAVTERIRFLPSVMLAPLLPIGRFVKEVNTLDQLSNGRLTLGVAVGGRADDFLAAEEPTKGRGQKFERQLEALKRSWAGEPQGEGVPWIGPKPVQAGGVPILIGGNSPAALARVPKYGDGFIVGGAPPQMAKGAVEGVLQMWKAAGRTDKPYVAGGTYAALGDAAVAKGAAYLKDYYAFTGPMADMIAGGMLRDPQAIRDAIKAYEDIGYDELILWASANDLEQVDRLAEFIR